jgi:steroid delta-isomerase
MPAPHASPPLQALVQWFETLSPQSLEQLSTHYSDQAYFKDPFNEVRGQQAIARIFAHMFATLDAPRFLVTECVEQAHGVMLLWDFHFRPRGQRHAWCIHGASHLKLDANGLVHWHRDYWDAAEELYAKLPLLGAVIRALGRRLQAR